jgi:hypothetical protein
VALRSNPLMSSNLVYMVPMLGTQWTFMCSKIGMQSSICLPLIEGLVSGQKRLTMKIEMICLLILKVQNSLLNYHGDRFILYLFISSIKYIAISLYLLFLSRNINQMQDTIIPVRNLQRLLMTESFHFLNLACY